MGEKRRLRQLLNGIRPFEITTVAALLAVGGWIYAANETHEDVAEQRKAIIAIQEQQVQHITERRYQDCFARCIPPIECPAPDDPLPASRCEPEPSSP